MPRLRSLTRPLAYPIGASGEALVLGDLALAAFAANRQRRPWQAEAGGLLFARLEVGRIEVVEATGPGPRDERARYFFAPNRARHREQIIQRHARELHFVGEWHTHPESVPRPSWLDRRSMADAFRRSSHALNAFVLVIVGTREPPVGLHVSLHDGSGHYPLSLGRAEQDVDSGREAAS